jgi:kynurenine formamidase
MIKPSLVALVTLLASAASIEPVMSAEPNLNDVYATLASKRFVDLTHTFGPTTPHWKGFGDEKVQILYTIAKDGFTVQQFTHVGQWGTHIDAPSHFHEGLRGVDQIDPHEMLMPLVVIDVHKKVELNPDYTLTVDDLKDWEARHGRIPEHAFVAMRTDWSKRWPDDAAMQNRDARGVAHYPGWSKATLTFLYGNRKITASGHETTDTDPGSSTTHDDYSLESYLLGLNHYQIEMLANLDAVPEAGALVMVTWPKPEGGTGFPARVVAILP